MTRYIGIDPGTHCGYAVLDEQGMWITSGVWDLKPTRYEGGGMRWIRLESYLNQLLGPLVRLGDVRLAYEEVRRHLGVDAAHVYGGVVATVQRACEGWTLPYLGIPVGTVKKLATGKGNAKKEAMILAAVERWKPVLTAPTEDEADAVWIAETLRRQLTHS